MGNPCSTCRHFRPYRPLSQRLAHVLSLEHSELVGELMKMMQDERQRRDEEAGLKVKLLSDRVERWPFQPQMSDCCALEEADGVYLFSEIKNRGGRCADHTPKDAVERACAGCANRRPAGGFDRDRAVLAQISQLVQNAAALGQNNQGPRMDDVVRQIGTAMAFEATQAYYLGKMTHRPPDYLAVCQVASSASDFVPCVVQNPHDACPDFVAAAPPTLSAPSTPGPAGLPNLPRPSWG